MAQAEVDRQSAALLAREGELTKELARLWQEQQKGTISAPILDANALAARKVAASLLNGSTPPGLVPTDASANIKLEQHLMNEREGVRIALRILSDKSIAIRAAEAVEWAEKNRAKWRELSREVIFTAIRSNALTQEVADFLRSCPDIHAVRLELGYWTEHVFVSDGIAENMVRDAIEAGIVTPADVKKAKTR
jgi:hypothetical protein